MILLRFGQNIDKDTQRDSKEALRRASKGFQDTLRRLLEAICVSKASDQLWMQGIDATLQRNVTVPFIVQFQDVFLRVGITK